MKHFWWYIVALVVVVTSIASHLLLTGPHMIDQPNLRAYQARMPLPPPDSVPLSVAVPQIPSPDEAAAMKNPVTPAVESLARGQVYYQYYCVFCHGDSGAGDGPVGLSYLPSPADLRSPRVQGQSDGQLYRAMLAGQGHEPVMQYTILPEHRWHLINWVRALGTVNANSSKR